MGNHNYRFVLIEIRQILHNSLFVVRVQGVGGFVQEDKLWIFIYGTGYQNSLALSLAYALSVLPYLGIVTQGQRFHVVGNIGNSGSVAKTLHVHIIICRGNVPGNGIREQITLLHNGSAYGAPPREVELLQVFFADVYFAFIRGVITQKQFHKRGFSASACTHNGGYFALRNIKVDVIQYIIRAGAVVFETEVFYFYRTIFGKFLHRAVFVFLVLLGMNFVHTVKTDAHILPAVNKTHYLFYRTV